MVLDISLNIMILFFNLELLPRQDHVVGQLYSLQYKGIFGMPDKGQTQHVQRGQTIVAEISKETR